ncbi:conserved exported hypothetical protein [Rubrivivax sp. A210]|nr:NF038132 family protein [Rubrivivax sp. A210]CAD5373687.1 conserved exported hypothetical protein [Rubrivivax sp. A210]
MSSSAVSFLALAALTLLAAPLAQAADISIGGTSWTATGSAGLIARDYDSQRTNQVFEFADAQLDASPTGNTLFGYLGTAGSTATGVSPLQLLDTVDIPGLNQTNGSKIVSSAFTAAANDRLTLYFNYISTDGRNYEDYAWARLVSAATGRTAAWLYTARSGNKPDADGTSDYVPGKVLQDQVGFRDLDNRDPNRQIAATLNNGLPVIGVADTNTQWAPLGASSGICWDVGTSCGYTGWVKSDYVVATTGSYFLEFGVTNWGDDIYDTALAYDFAHLSQAQFNGLTVLENVAVVPEPQAAALMLGGLGLLGWLGRRRAG